MKPSLPPAPACALSQIRRRRSESARASRFPERGAFLPGSGRALRLVLPALLITRGHRGMDSPGGNFSAAASGSLRRVITLARPHPRRTAAQSQWLKGSAWLQGSCHPPGVRSLFYDAESRMNSSRFTKLLRYHGDPLPVYLHRQELPAGLRDGLFHAFPRIRLNQQHNTPPPPAPHTLPARAPLRREFSMIRSMVFVEIVGRFLRRRSTHRASASRLSPVACFQRHAHLLRDLRNALQVIHHRLLVINVGLEHAQLLMADCAACRCNTPPGGVRVRPDSR